MPKVASMTLIQWIFIPAIVIGYLVKINDAVPYPMFTELTAQLKQKPHGTTVRDGPLPLHCLEQQPGFVHGTG